MRAALWLVVTTVCAVAENQNRRTKLPYIADAVGNSLPPPSDVPATVGSPVNLITPDKYEFYTFDESGELVKRLMTLEEIQAIVAAGEETEGLVTFANDNQPTIAFNFTQPSQTKVHSVVTNVQNVLKAQMEAHKKKPNVQPTLDTPDVSDSWSLILPSIFGNTGVDIVPDKTSGSFITPETETFEIDNLNEYKNTQSKESNDIPTISTYQEKYNENKKPTKEPEKFISTTASTIKSTTRSPVTSTKRILTTTKLYSTTKTKQPDIHITKKTTSSKPLISSSTTTMRTTTSTTIRPTESTTNNIDSNKPNKTQQSIINNNNKNHDNKTTIKQKLPPMRDETIQYERISTFSPISTAVYITEKTTNKPITSTKKTTFSENNLEKLPNILGNKVVSGTTLLPISLDKDRDNEKLNSTTLTTQSVSPSTTVSSTEVLLSQNIDNQDDSETDEQEIIKTDKKDYNKENQSMVPMFDVAQSISQIASDLGNNFVPIPTSNTLLDTTKTSTLLIESKENLDIEIPTESGDANEIHTNTTNNPENFVKITTFDPHEQNKNKISDTINVPEENNNILVTTSLPLSSSTGPSSTSPNIMDAVISESMGDLLSQVVHDAPDPTSIIISQNDSQANEVILSTQSLIPTVNQESTSLETTTNIQKTTTTTISPQSIVESSVNKIVTGETKIDINNKLSKENINHVPSIIISDVNEIKVKPNAPSDVNEIKVKPSAPKDNSQNERDDTNSLPKNDTNTHTKKKVESEQKVDNIFITKTQNLLKNSSTDVNAIKVNSSMEFFNLTDSNYAYKSSFTNKTSYDNNKISDKIHKNKVTEDIPKVDEFKKKIQKVNIDDTELANKRNNSWKLIPTVIPSKTNEDKKNKHKIEGFYTPEAIENKNIVLEFPKENQGLEVTTKDLGDDILQFTELCNELAFRYWNVMIENVDKKRSIVFSPYSITSMLAMMFMGAKGGTSGEMNDVLKLDDMVTFNPHFTLKNISDSIETTSASGVAISAFIRELYSERSKGKMLTFYKERAQHFYNGHVEEINFKLISDVIRRRTNLLVKRYTWGRIHEYLKSNSITMNPPLAAFSANIFFTDCTGSSVEGRDGEMYFVVSPNVRQRRLVPVPAVVYKSNFLAGYDPVLDATAAALGNTNSVVSTLFLMPGQQGNVVHADDLENLEKRVLDTNLSTAAWNGLLRTLLPRVGLELQIPRFSHKSIFNVSSTLKKMGLKELFDADHADLGGLNGPSRDLYLSDMLQLTSFVTCGEGAVSEQHHVEEYPDTVDYLRKRRTSRWITGWEEPTDYQRAFHDPHDIGDAMHLPLHLRPRQARLPARSSQPARLKFDRPFLYFVRHNPSGMILYVGRYNPRLLP